MKPIKAAILFLLAVCTYGAAFTQTATIANRIYKINEEIRATITAPATKAINMGVENDLARASQNYPLEKGASQTIVLGRATSPGQYMIKFLTADGFERSYLIFVLPPATNYTTPDLVKVAKPVTSIPVRYMTNLRNLTEQQWKNIHDRTLRKFVQDHIVSGTTTFVICVTAIAQPTLWIQCGAGVTDNAKDYAIDMLEEAAVEMRTAGTLTPNEVQTIKNALATAEFVFSLYSAFSLDGKKIRVDGVELFAGSIQYAGKVATDKEEVETGTTIAAEYAKKVDVLIKLKKKLP